MKKIIDSTWLLVIISTSLIAAPVGSGFNYQGSLNDQNSPANGSYDILFKAYSVESGGTEYDVVPEFLATTVVDGLFNIDNVDFGDALFDGEEYWIEVSVRLTGTSTYTALSPRQRLNATPYAVQAEFLAANGASAGDVLQFIGGNWVGNALNIEPTPWANNGANITYNSGRVGIGVNPASALHIKDTGSNPLIVEGGNNMYMSFKEGVSNRGYIGSFQTQANTTDADFEIGTFSGSLGSMHIVTGSNQPRITVTSDGKVGINNLTPEADLHVAGDTFVGPRGTQGSTNAKLDVNSTATGGTADPLRVRKNGDIKFYVDSNGGASVGSWDTPPDNGLRVAGNTYHSGDVKQDIGKHGLVKYLLEVNCSANFISRSYDGVNAGPVTVARENNLCAIKFPVSIENSFFQVTVARLSSGSAGATAQCLIDNSDSTKLICIIYDANQSINFFNLMISVY